MTYCACSQIFSCCHTQFLPQCQDVYYSTSFTPMTALQRIQVAPLRPLPLTKARLRRLPSYQKKDGLPNLKRSKLASNRCRGASKTVPVSGCSLSCRGVQFRSRGLHEGIVRVAICWMCLHCSHGNTMLKPSSWNWSPYRALKC